MFSLVRRSDFGPDTVLLRAWEPLRRMEEWLELEPVRDTREVAAVSPALEVKELGDAYVIKADLPGVDDKDLDISLDDGVLTLSGKRDEEAHDDADSYCACERWYGRFERAVSLPDAAADGVVAQLKNGVLTVTVPKRAEVQPKRIPVQTGA
jgi:HSP20 family protein